MEHLDFSPQETVKLTPLQQRVNELHQKYGGVALGERVDKADHTTNSQTKIDDIAAQKRYEIFREKYGSRDIVY